MQTTTLKTLTLHRLPMLEEELDHRLREAIRDCVARPDIRKARSVRLDLQFLPSADDERDVVISPTVSSKLPARPLETVTGRRAKGNQLQFDFDNEEPL